MFSPDVDAHGFTIAICTCDVCGHAIEEKTVHTKHRTPSKRGVDEGQCITRLQGKGWTYIKRVLRCPTCETARKPTPVTKNNPKEEIIMAEVINTPTDTRQPTREQKRQIMALLEDVYDTKAGRYAGGETDKTVADALGNNIMFGWVSALREEFFGPDGSNDEIAALILEVVAWREESAKVAAKCNDSINDALKHLRDFNASRNKVADFVQRLEKLKKAVGPKAESV